MTLAGRCHCGNLEVSFETARSPAELALRECGCTFCRRHGVTAVTDPAGRLEVVVRSPADLSRYVFGLRTAEFLVCRTCGVFVCAVCTVDGRTYATLNANVLEARASLTVTPTPVDYDGETAATRLQRRARAWTPAEVRGVES
jgi:hypothetical protein